MAEGGWTRFPAARRLLVIRIAVQVAILANVLAVAVGVWSVWVAFDLIVVGWVVSRVVSWRAHRRRKKLPTS